MLRIHWEPDVRDSLGRFLLGQLRRYCTDTIPKSAPEFLGEVHVISLELGSVAPTMEVVAIREPFDAFYHEHPRDRAILTSQLRPILIDSISVVDVSSSGSPSSLDLDDPAVLDGEEHCYYRIRAPHPSDIQVHARFSFNGPLRLELETELRLNQPTPVFMKLPIHLAVTHVNIQGMVAVAYLRNKINACFLPDGFDASSPDSTPPDHHHIKPLEEFFDVRFDMKMESEIGNKDKHILKNVAKIERFLCEQVKDFFRQKLTFPNFYSYYMNGTTHTD